MSSRAVTRTEQVYAAIRADILSGRLEPGVKLPFAELTERYGASMGALREALHRLAEQALVVNEPQLGFRVQSLSVDDLRDLTTARCEIEGLALRYAIANGDLAWESAIVAAFYALERTPMSADGDESSGSGFFTDEGTLLAEDWALAHSRFHSALYAACPNQRIKAMATSLRDAAELYRHWSARSKDPRDTIAEHQGIVDAVLARDTERAVGLLERHLRHTTRLLIDRASELGTQPAR
ncbi:MAG: hypothetical protein RI958_2004 [Actinomycetota bacterium]|jgi:DNA-binding GntR family transcriptional regulator